MSKRTKAHKLTEKQDNDACLADLSERITQLVSASMNARYSDVRKIGSYIAKDISQLGFDEQAQKISSALRKKGVPLQASGQLEMLPVDTKSKLPLVEEVPWPSEPLFLDEETASTFNRFLEDAKNSHRLSELGIASRLCMLLVGPPGTGKTLMASHLASRLKRPFYVARLDSLISSLLGETAKNIRAIFDFIPHRNAVLLLDEIDAIAKIRDDGHELGEIKRVVNTLIQGLDSIDDQTVVIGATNHPHLLDKAIWRRFPYKIELDNPDLDTREAMWACFLFQNQDENKISVSLAVLSDGFSGCDIYELSMRARRESVLNNKALTAEDVGHMILRHLQKQSLFASSQIDNEGQRKNLARFMCIDRGLKQIEAAKILGVTRQTISNYLKE